MPDDLLHTQCLYVLEPPIRAFRTSSGYLALGILKEPAGRLTEFAQA